MPTGPRAFSLLGNPHSPPHAPSLPKSRASPSPSSSGKYRPVGRRVGSREVYVVNLKSTSFVHWATQCKTAVIESLRVNFKGSMWSSGSMTVSTIVKGKTGGRQLYGVHGGWTAYWPGVFVNWPGWSSGFVVLPLIRYEVDSRVGQLAAKL